MTTHHTHDLGLEGPADLDRLLAAYRPTGVPSAVWQAQAQDAADLVRKAGVMTRARVERDIKALGAALAHLVEGGRDATIANALSDTTLLSLDQAMQSAGKSPGTRERQRGVLRRLQAVHAGLPWRTERRADGERITELVSHRGLVELYRVEKASSENPDKGDAVAFGQAVSAMRAARRGEVGNIDALTWSAARRFSESQGWPISKHVLRAMLTHELLQQDQPIAQLITTFGFTRRDLDLALTRVGELPQIPDGDHQRSLRGGQ